MLVVIQCAATKQPDAGHLRTRDNRPVLFVARPELAPPSGTVHHARPDDASDTDGTWRDVLKRINVEQPDNPFGLVRAGDLYVHPAYARLRARVGPDRLFVLSAGWGLLPASFLTPAYDITFAAAAEPYKRRRPADRYQDFTLPEGLADTPVLFFGGTAYAPLFARLTQGHRAERTVLHSSRQPPAAPGCRLERFVTTTRTNWHYGAVDAWLDRL